MNALSIPKTSYYWILGACNQKPKQPYKGLRKKLEKIIQDHPGYGYRRIQDELLKKYHVKINHKPLKKLLKIWHLRRIRRVKPPKPSQLKQYIKELGAGINLINRIHNPRPLQIIFTDFSEIKCCFGKIEFIPFVCLVSKRILGWNVDYADDAENALKAYQKARCYLKKMKVDLSQIIIHQDQDTVFTSYKYAGTLLNNDITLSFTERGFKDNPYIESFFSRFKDEYKDIISTAKNLEEVRRIIKKCVLDWNKHRIHSSLKGRSPDEFIHTVY